MSETEAMARVLFVDDEPRVLTTMRMLFRGKYDLEFANGGAEALEIIRRQPVDVIVSDQRMPEMTGIEFLRNARDIDKAAMRILLTGYSDLKAIVDSINQGEIFRYVQKPWDNKRFLDTVAQAVKAARISKAAVARAAGEADLPADSNGVLVIDEDGLTANKVAEILGNEAKVVSATSLSAAVDSLERDNIAVVISETRVNGSPVVSLLGVLKQHRPELVSVVITERADANMAISMINEGQVYRMISKPIHDSQCRIALRSAIRHHQDLVGNADLHKRYVVEDAAEPKPEAAPVNLSLLERIRALRAANQSS